MSSYIENLFSLDGKVCLVTGASRGIGQAIADAMHLAGGVVIGVGRSIESQTANNWRYIQCDVTDSKELSDLFEEIKATCQQLDVLVNAAGITLPVASQPADSEQFMRTLDTNLSATHRCCMLAADLMSLSASGSIINVTSIGSVLGFPGNPAYVASKGGLRMLSKALAFDFAVRGIRVNNLAPGYIKTDMTKGSFSDPILHEQRLDRMMIKRWGESSDLCGAAIYLASDASGYVTGTDLFVDGGWSAKGI
ncbi:MAG: NAD(P)-dependent dehydrogenase (short-subunit alcohol dehydrogenase family) [Candidatus Azotimanducaceae bacterium]|jgi:NAD(P)-dependent dehydrogenase (short-subunit alcohol dehydrogenase family)